MERIGFTASEKKSFENVDERTSDDGRTDDGQTDGRTTDACLYYKLTGELIIMIITLFQEDRIFGTNASLTYGPRL